MNPHDFKRMKFRLHITSVSAIAIAAACDTSMRDDQRAQSDGADRSARVELVGAATELGDSGEFFVAEPAAVALSDTYIFVADAGTGTILQYSRQGTPIRRIGRRGKGPAEFSAPSAIVAVGNTAVAVADAGSRRVLLFDAESGKLLASRQLRSNPFSLSVSGDSLLAGTFDGTQQTTMLLASFSDTLSTAMGTVSPDYRENRRTRFAYPFSVAAFGAGGTVMSMVASPWLYRTDLNGTTTDSIRMLARDRRGVPEDLERQLETNKDPNGEMLLISALMTLANDGPLTYLFHADFHPEGQGEAAKAFVTVVNWSNRVQCVDAEVPVIQTTRPAFAFKNDTLVVVQNMMQGGDSVAVGTLRLFRVSPCV